MEKWVEVHLNPLDDLNTMTCVRFVVNLIGLFLGKMAQANTPKIFSSLRQEKLFVSARAGDNVTLQCFYENHVDALFWYRQYLGQKPMLISTFKNYITFHDDFKNNPRFKPETAEGKNNLKITDLKMSDSAIYFCASSHLYKLDFAEGTTVSVEHPSSKVNMLEQSASETALPGISVSLNCIVQTRSCGENQSVYWFKNSEESQPGLVYSLGVEDELCKKKNNSSMHSCVYNLPIKNPNTSHTGTYYCAVASCGRILFGNGTKLNLKEDISSAIYFWIGAFFFTSILSVLLAFSLCVIKKKESSKSSESDKKPFPNPDVKDFHYEGKPYYAAYLALPSNQLGKKDPTWCECVYHRVN